MASLPGIRRVIPAILVAVIAALAAAPGASAADPDGVSVTLEGCRLDLGDTLPNNNGDFICSDDDYTTGNLGKAWNELDLVPYRLTLDAGNSAPNSQTYTVSVVLDREDGGRPGYDVLTTLVLNEDLSDAACTQGTVSNEQTLIPGLGGIDKSIYREITVTQAQNTECVYDFVGRLALGSHLFPGASLHGNAADEDQETAGIGARDVSIPVNEISPQELRKDMSASQGSDHVWDITKGATPANLDFNDTCDPDASRSAAVSVTITWTRLQATPSGPITVITHVYAKNPASRVITVNVSDDIRSATTVLDTVASGAVDVPANTELLVLTHQTTVPAGTPDLNDVATATYTDKVTGVAVPGNTTATASATPDLSGPTLNQTATINDVENITGAGFTFSADSFSGASGAFDGGYVAGFPTTGPVSWTSASQNNSGSVTFSKTVYVATGTAGNGTLSDIATINGSDGFSANTNASVALSASALVNLTISKTIPNVVGVGDPDQAFGFTVKDSQGNTVATPTITFAQGDPTTKTVTVTGLQPGTYDVFETSAPPGWILPDYDGGDPPESATITAAECAETVSFTNRFAPASAEAVKVTVPASSGAGGAGAGWDMTLTGPGTPVGGETVTTVWDADREEFVAIFTTVLQDGGSYTITETLKTGWAETGSTGCSFTVDYPADFNRVFTCTKENTAQAKILVDKVTVPSGSSQSFDFTASYDADGFSLTDAAAPNDSGFLTPGVSYSVAETVPAGWDLTGATCDGGNTPDTIVPEPGETVTCTFENTQRGRIIVDKITDPSGSSQSFDFTASYGNFSLTDAAAPNDSGLLPPTTYSVSETVPAGWTLTGATCDDGSDPSAIDLDAGETVTCTFRNRLNRARIVVDKVTVPSGSSQSFDFTASYDSDGFSLTDAATPNDSGDLLPGVSYDVSETVPAGWALTSATCDGGNTPANIVPEPGETVTCTFTNTQQAKILVDKVTVPSGSSQSFDFTASYDADGFSLTDADAPNDSGFVTPGVSHDVAETVPAGWDLTSATCDGANTPANIVPEPGETVTCTFTNTQRGRIIVDKVTVPSGSSQSFDFTASYDGDGFSLTDAADPNDSGLLVPGTYDVDEVNVPSGWDLTGETCDDGSDPDAIDLNAGETVTCTFTNTQRGQAKVIKTVLGAPPSGTDAFTFQLRQGASPTQNGTVLESKVANAGNGGIITFDTLLIPGQTYQLCEIIAPAWATTLGDFVPASYQPPDGQVPDPNVDNSILCVDFTVQPGELKTFTVDNAPPPGGNALTIGFWKNHASCAGSKGNQESTLDEILVTFPIASGQTTHGFFIGYLYIDTCAEAVALLDKRTLGGKKVASDPLFNMAAQLVAYHLNTQAGAYKSPVAMTAAEQAQALLSKYKFNGTKVIKTSASDASLANSLARTLDDYNNNRL